MRDAEPRERRLPTLTDVARAAGVSRSTASRTLSGNRHMDDEHAHRVRLAAEQLGYVADVSARAMRAQQNAISFLVDHVDTPAVGRMAYSMESAAHSAGSVVTVSAAGEGPAHQLENLRRLRAMRPRAVILTGQWASQPEVAALAEVELRHYVEDEGGRAVIIGPSLLEYPRVTIDDERSSLLIADHVAARHPDRVLVLTGPSTHPTHHMRAEAMVSALAEWGIDKVNVMHTGLRPENASSVVAGIAEGDIAEAVMCTNDSLALGALAELRQRGLSVPNRCIVTGFDDIPIARDLYPGLTTIAVPFEEMGAIAIELATAPIAGLETHRVVQGRLIVRGSTSRDRAPLSSP